MDRSKLGRLGAGRVAAAACASALLIGGCGDSSSSSSTSTPAPTPTAAATGFEPVLLRLDVYGDAYTSAVYGGQADLTAERTAIAKERDTVYATDRAVRKLKTPPAAQRALVGYLTQSGYVVAALDRLYKQPNMHAIQTQLGSTLSPSITKFLEAETPLRASLGLPKYDPWLSERPVGETIYSDTLSAPSSKLRRLMGSNVRFAGGGLEVAAAANLNGLTGPSTPYNFDGRHIAVQVDATALKGNPYIGIVCPPGRNVPDSHLVGQIAPGAQWSIGVLHLERNGYLMHAPERSKAIKVGKTNHLRVDCDQWRPGLTTVRVYVNGQFLGASSGAFSLDPSKEAGVAIVSPTTAALVKFTNWRVSKLGS